MKNAVSNVLSDDALKALIYRIAEERWGVRAGSNVDNDPTPINKAIMQTVEKQIRDYIATNLVIILEEVYPKIRAGVDNAAAEYINEAALTFIFGEGTEGIFKKYEQHAKWTTN